MIRRLHVDKQEKGNFQKNFVSLLMHVHVSPEKARLRKNKLYFSYLFIIANIIIQA
jgi:hypothetical protein